jgi:hypothetical protein
LKKQALFLLLNTTKTNIPDTPIITLDIGRINNTEIILFCFNENKKIDYLQSVTVIDENLVLFRSPGAVFHDGEFYPY